MESTMYNYYENEDVFSFTHSHRMPLRILLKCWNYWQSDRIRRMLFFDIHRPLCCNGKIYKIWPNIRIRCSFSIAANHRYSLRKSKLGLGPIATILRTDSLYSRAVSAVWLQVDDTRVIKIARPSRIFIMNFLLLYNLNASSGICINWIVIVEHSCQTVIQLYEYGRNSEWNSIRLISRTPKVVFAIKLDNTHFYHILQDCYYSIPHR